MTLKPDEKIAAIYSEGFYDYTVNDNVGVTCFEVVAIFPKDHF